MSVEIALKLDSSIMLHKQESGRVSGNTVLQQISPVTTPTCNFGEDFKMLLKRCVDNFDTDKFSTSDYQENEINVNSTSIKNEKQNDEEYLSSTTCTLMEEGKCIENFVQKLLAKGKPMDYPVTGKKKQLKKKTCQRKQKKWKTIPFVELGFEFSVFPKKTSVNNADNTEEMAKEFRKFQTLLDKTDCDNQGYSTIPKSNVKLKFDWCKHDAKDKIIEMYDELEIQKLGNGKLRNKKKWKVMKAHKQVKSKHCLNVSNGGHVKKLFCKHRIINLMKMGIDIYRNPNRLSVKKIDKQKGFKPGNKPKFISQIPKVEATRARSTPGSYPIATQQLRHIIDAFNFDGEFSADLVNILQTIQYRDISPEDYDLLLQLDERIKPKTLENSILDALKTDKVSLDCVGEICMVCLEPYEYNQIRKFLPCGHVFHEQCIIMWLTNSSTRCPIDNSEIEPS